MFNFTKVQFKLGETIRFYADYPQDYRFSVTVFSTSLEKYLNSSGKFESTAPVLIYGSEKLTVTHGPSSAPITTKIREFSVPTSGINGPDILLVNTFQESTASPGEVHHISVVPVYVGDLSSTQPSLVTVYGSVFDAYGNPVIGESVTFTVLNSATYFDNAPTTTLNATAQTDRQGRFELQLNRAYNYVFSISRLNYTKMVRLSSLPANVSAVELVVGEGTTC